MKAQGALEYLIIIAVVLGISAVVVLFVTGVFTGSSSGADLSKCRVATANCQRDLTLGLGTSCAQCDAACKDATGREVVFDAVYACKTGKLQAISSETGLVLGWHFDEGSGSSAIDASGNGYTGSVVGGVSYVLGRFGTALSFDGSDDYVQITNLNIPTASGSKVTVEFWMNWSGLNLRMPMGFSTYDLWFSGYFGFNTGRGEIRGMSTTGLANTWVFVSAIFNSGDSTLSELYINGIKQTLTLTGSAPATQPLSTTMTVGNWNNMGSLYFYRGMIDEFRLYNRALTPREIANHYLG